MERNKSIRILGIREAVASQIPIASMNFGNSYYYYNGAIYFPKLMRKKLD